MLGATEGAGRVSKQLGWMGTNGGLFSILDWSLAKNLTCAVKTCKSSATPLAHESVC